MISFFGREACRRPGTHGTYQYYIPTYSRQTDRGSNFFRTNVCTVRYLSNSNANDFFKLPARRDGATAKASEQSGVNR